MSLNRFRFLAANLRFDDQTTRRIRWPGDRFAAMRDIFVLFNKALGSAVYCGDWLSFDETLYPGKHKIAFRVFNPGKLHHYGLDFKSINDSELVFTYQTAVYAGRPKGPPDEHYVQGVQNVTVKTLGSLGELQDLRGKNVTCDRLYTSRVLADFLWRNKMTILGTIKNNRRGIPAEFKEGAGRPEGDYMVAYDTDSQMSLHSFLDKKKKGKPNNVLLLTTLEPVMGRTIDDGRDKPPIYKLYDFTMGGTDRADQVMAHRSTRAKSQRWPMLVVYYTLDTARINAATVRMLQTMELPVPEGKEKHPPINQV
jgi:hypothetical protein